MERRDRLSEGRSPWILDSDKFLSPAELRRLLRTSEQRKDRAKRKGTKVAVREWFLIRLATETGLRVQEMADLCCGDVQDRGSGGVVVVRNGKGGKARVVHIRKEFLQCVAEYLDWRRQNGEALDDSTPLFIVRGRAMSKRGLQKCYERSLKNAGVTQPKGVGIHSLRHTYASFLLQASKFNLRLVQIQLGHSSIQTTQVYAHLFDHEIQKAVGRLYG